MKGEGTPSVASTATEELYYTNLLRLQATQLLSESVLPLSSQTGLLKDEVKWSKDVHAYIETVQNTISNIKAAVLSPDDVKLDNKGGSKSIKGEKCWIQLHSDKARKHFECSNNGEKNNDQEWKINFPGGECLKMSSINSYAANGAGLTTTVANANSIPMIDVAVLLPVKNRYEEDDVDHSADGMISGKDYLNGRYFDKRNILAVHIAKFLSQKKQRKVVGSVHITNELDGDFRKVSLILTPPLPEEKGTKQNSTKKQKKEAEKSHKKKKIRFRLRIVFGVQYDDSMRNSVEGNTGWIANARLFPSRCNNKVVHLPDQDGVTNNHGTPGYNNSLASDLHHLTTTQILHSASSSALKTFTEAWTLLKIWCLQRGFLRGHDTFSEKSVGLSLAYLYRTRLVSIRMDSVQVFNVWMKFISDKDWTGAGQVGKKKIQSDINKNNIRHSSSLAYQEIELTLKPGKMARAAVVMPESEMTEQQTILNCIQNRLHASDLKHQENDENSMDVPKTLLESFKLNTDSPIFLDPTMTVNYFGNMSPSFMSEVQSEASKALNCIHYHGDGCGSRVDTFRQLFLEQQRFWTRYDSYLKLNIDDIAFPDKASSNNGKGLHFWGENIQDLGNYEAISRGLSKVLKMALGDRIDCVRTLTTGNGIVTEHLIPNNGDIGTTPIINGDEIPCTPIRNSTESSFTGFDLCSINSPIADGARKAKTITIGLRINPETCHRVVDRGPPADDADLSSVFVSLWGAQKAQLRRFKDGAIIHAVVWNDVESEIAQGRIQYEGSIKTGDIVERITRHIYRKHFCKNDIEEPPCPQFALNNMMSLVEIAQKEEDNGQSKSSEQMHKQIMSAFDSLATFLRNNSVIGKTPSGESVSKLGLPLRIDAVEAISPSLRYSELFPPSPHPFLGGDKSSNKKVAGVIVNDPIVIQIRFQGSAKWPQDINAMGAAKCAMLMQLAEGIEVVRNKGGTNSSSFDGPINVMPTYLDLGYQGYNFRIIVRADEELKMLQSLRSPSQEAIAIKQALQKRHLISSMHHFMIHGVHTKYPSSSNVVRLLKRWLSAHMLSDLVPGEAVELIVASVFTDPAPFHTPNSVTCGFMRSLKLISTHDWLREPVIIDPENHLSVEDRAQIMSVFENARGPDSKNGPPMFIISPYNLNEEDQTWKPSFTTVNPERVVLGRVCALAKRSHDFLLSSSLHNLQPTEHHDSWMAVFQESPNSLKSYSTLLRIDPELVYDIECGSTGCEFKTNVDSDEIITPYQRSLEKRSLGPKQLRRKRYKNLVSIENNVVYSWNPVQETVAKLRSELGHLAVFFYNEHTPNVIGCLWRPEAFKGQPFSVIHSEYKRPVVNQWDENSLVITNANDVMRVIKFIVQDTVVDLKILDDRSIKSNDDEENKANANKPKRKRRNDDSDEEDSSEDEDE